MYNNIFESTFFLCKSLFEFTNNYVRSKTIDRTCRIPPVLLRAFKCKCIQVLTAEHQALHGSSGFVISVLSNKNKKRHEKIINEFHG